jgi:hypothetical protein
MARSPQLTVKFAGTHLTKEPGMNRYSGAALFDAGLGPIDVTANVQYAAANDVSLGIDQRFTAKSWTLAASAVAHLAPDSLVAGRTIDWSSGVTGVMFQDRAALPLRRREAALVAHPRGVDAGVEEPVAVRGRDATGPVVDLDQRLEMPGQKHVVCVAEGDQLAVRLGDALVPRSCDAAVLAAHHAHRLRETLCDHSGRIARAVVDHDHFEVAVGLPERGGDCCAHRALGVEGRDDDRNPH